MSAPTLRLLLARHGEVAANRELRYVGTLDEPLTAAGLEQADRLAAALARLPLAAVYSSPLQRARETGRRIALSKGLDVALEPRLREQAFGDWEGRTRREVLEDDRERLLRWEGDLGSAPPGGDSLVEVQERMLDLTTSLAKAHAPGAWVVLVSHVGPIKALLCAALGVPLAAARHLFLDPATLSVVDWGAHPVVRLFNAHGHLGWCEARWMKGV